jgi:hypothetical protein
VLGAALIVALGVGTKILYSLNERFCVLFFYLAEFVEIYS